MVTSPLWMGIFAGKRRRKRFAQDDYETSNREWLKILNGNILNLTRPSLDLNVATAQPLDTLLHNSDRQFNWQRPLVNRRRLNQPSNGQTTDASQILKAWELMFKAVGKRNKLMKEKDRENISTVTDPPVATTPKRPIKHDTTPSTRRPHKPIPHLFENHSSDETSGEIIGNNLEVSISSSTEFNIVPTSAHKNDEESVDESEGDWLTASDYLKSLKKKTIISSKNQLPSDFVWKRPEVSKSSENQPPFLIPQNFHRKSEPVTIVKMNYKIPPPSEESTNFPTGSQDLKLNRFDSTVDIRRTPPSQQFANSYKKGNQNEVVNNLSKPPQTKSAVSLITKASFLAALEEERLKQSGERMPQEATINSDPYMTNNARNKISSANQGILILSPEEEEEYFGISTATDRVSSFPLDPTTTTTTQAPFVAKKVFYKNKAHTVHSRCGQ